VADPLELERLLRPLRAWLGREVGGREARELPLVAELRQAAARKLADLAAEPEPSGRLAASLHALEPLREQAQSIPTGSSELLTQAQSWLARALADLNCVGLQLLEAISRAEIEAVTVRMLELEKVQQRVLDLERMLESYQACLEGARL